MQLDSDTENGWPAMHLINKEVIKEADSKGLKIDCIFNKTTIEKKWNSQLSLYINLKEY